jgi:hypothetical protein
MLSAHKDKIKYVLHDGLTGKAVAVRYQRKYGARKFVTLGDGG